MYDDAHYGDLSYLRHLAGIQRDTAIEARVRGGEDPAIVTEEVPEVDEIVINMLRDDALDDQGLAAEYSLARLAASGTQAASAELRSAADEIDARIYREIALDYPELTKVAWRLIGALQH
ncbi:hypothetical protein [Gulosibacter bifidus]|uniref:Uncharacterized protein n=1 Tax=Gulosibacter bifidus TaxID=272239 RepID=A0ABW5RJX8_9MICO|nr:hypothetical protein [Gulosibacter bifidus]